MFKIINIDTTGIASTNKLIKAYNTAITRSDISAKVADAVQRRLERHIGNRLGASIVNGKIGQQNSADFLITSASPIMSALYGSAKNETTKSLEFKGSTIRSGATIGQISIGGKQKDLYSPDRLNPFTAQSIKNRLLPSELKNKEGYLVDLDPNLLTSGDVSEYIFSNYFAKDKRLQQLFYQKASTLLLANTYYLDDYVGTRLIGIKVPLKYFNPTFFKAKIVDKAIVVSLKDNFQKKFINELNVAMLETKKREKGFKKSFNVNGSRYTIDYLPTMTGEQAFAMQITNSIKVGPVDTFIGRVEGKKDNKKQTPQSFISAAQWTYLTQKRLGNTMDKIGKPNAPNLKERSGRFRRSVAVSVNYKTRLLQYTYNPLYSSLEAYGYEPSAQIADSIREVAQQFYTQKFNILRKPML